jgi:hypothetical protein
MGQIIFPPFDPPKNNQNPKNYYKITVFKGFVFGFRFFLSRFLQKNNYICSDFWCRESGLKRNLV